MLLRRIHRRFPLFRYPTGLTSIALKLVVNNGTDLQLRVYLFPSYQPSHGTKTPYLHNCTQTNLDLQNTTIGNHIYVQHRNPRTLLIECSAHNNGRTMVRAEYDNTEGAPNSNGSKRNQALQLPILQSPQRAPKRINFKP
jgi:hypothetical protein